MDCLANPLILKKIISPEAIAQTKALARKFGKASPFPHVVIDGFLSEKLCGGLLREFPAYDRERFSNIYGHPGKAVYENIGKLGASFLAVDNGLSSPAFLNWIGQITGIENLIHDPLYFGGGAQENISGMGLFPHIDFNRHPIFHWHRRVNLLLYLNPEWKSEWGGCLKLYRETKNRKDAIKTIAPIFNRCVIFATSEKSWHGVTPIRTSTGQQCVRSRKSMSVYFYTLKRSDAVARHSTIWALPGFPSGIKAGRRLSRRDMAGINRALFLRDVERDSLICPGSRLDWKSPLPSFLRPGYCLSSSDVAWIKRELARRDERLKGLWHGKVPARKQAFLDIVEARMNSLPNRV
ncbi:MAG: 2OG-Fe(II) oxygenase [Elusimicrobiota bacterium]